MEDTAKMKIAEELKQLLEDHKGIDTVLMDVRGRSPWADFFLIATAASQGHLRGLVRHITEFLAERGIATKKSLKQVDEKGWILIDCGDFVIHLMDEEKRAFYDLERLWQDQSSKSS